MRLLPSTTGVLHVPVSEEFATPRKLDLFQLERPTRLGLVLVIIQHIVLTSRCKPKRALLQPDWDNKVPWLLPVTMLEIALPRLPRTVRPSDQKLSTHLKHQQLLGIRLLQTHRCRNPSHPRIQQRPIVIVLHIFSGFSMYCTRRSFVDLCRPITSFRIILSRSGIAELKIGFQRVQVAPTFGASSTENVECTHVVNGCSDNLL